MKITRTSGITKRAVRRALGGVALVGLASTALAGCDSGGGDGGQGQSDAGATGSQSLDDGGTQVNDNAYLSLEEAPAAGEVVKQSRVLGLEVLASLAGETLVTSPASTVIALSMLASGATGEAEEEFTAVLGAEGEERDKAVNALMGTLDPYRADVADIDINELPEHPQVHLANQVVIDEGLEVKESYIDSVKEWFHSVIATVKLNSDEGKALLNDWVEENTAGLIEKSAVELDESTRMVLQNAVVFAAAWQIPFDAYATGPATFNLADGTTAEVDFMNATMHVPYAEADGWQMLELPYGDDGNLVARYVMAPEGTDLATAGAPILAVLETSLESQTVDVSIPKLDIASKADLIKPLEDNGLSAVFTGNDNALGYISDTVDLYVDQIWQQGRVILDEAGTVAAVVTEVAVAESSAMLPGVSFVADRPHLIIIEDKTVGWDLFQILVNDPREQ